MTRTIILELYTWGFAFATMALVRPQHARHLSEWACAAIIAAAWPLVVPIRVSYGIRRARRRTR